MVKNFFKIAIRTIRKQRLFSVINILGLSLGMTASLFVLLYITDELSYDQFHTDIEQIYRIDLQGRISGQEVVTTSSCSPLGPAMISEIPEIKDFLRLQKMQGILVKNETETFVEKDNIFFADSNFFSFFDFVLLEGDKNTVLQEPNTVVLTQKSAKKYFGDEPAIGKQLLFFSSGRSYTVTGISANTPSNSHFHFNMILSGSNNDNFKSEVWLNNSFPTYVKGHRPLDIAVVNSKIAEITRKNVGPQLEQMMGTSFDEFIKQGNAYGYFLHPLKEIHLYSTIDDEIEAGGDISYVYLFAAIGIFIILIACINFMNLSTAKSAGRAKEVGLRKTFGSARGQLINQFLIESLIFSVLSGIIAFGLVYLLLPSFNSFAGKGIEVSQLFSLGMIGTIVGLSLLVGVLAGSYPAFYLTAFRPSEILRGQLKSGAKSGKLRGVLVVVQFAISIVLIVCTLVVYQQLRYTQNINLGFDRENVIIVQNAGRLDNNRKVFKNKLMELSNISAVSYTNSIIPGVNNTTVFRTPGAEDDHLMGTYLADYEHLDALAISIKEGRNFSRDFASDSSAVLVNEATVVEMGWDNPIGEKLWRFGENEEIFTVVGVMKDFNFESLHSKVRPLVLRFLNEANTLVVRFDKGTSASDAVASIESQWKNISPNEMFQYNFLDEDFDALYRSEQRLGKIFYLFTGIAIFIASLGLFGLAAFIAEQRTKEIGIRKSLGASVFSISTLLSREFVKYVAFALLIAIYPAYYIMSNWLEGFEYRVDISPVVFIVSGFAALSIAMLTVSYQAIKAAKVNPVESLKYE
jgi:putative ABC transport system permease protein